MLLVVLLSFLHAKPLLMELLFKSLQTYAKQILGLMLANYIHIRCVNPCRAVFIRVGTWIQRRVDLRLDKTRPAFLKIWSSPIRTKPECKIESFFATGTQEKNNCFSVDGFCSHCSTVFEAMGCFYDFCACHEVLPPLTEDDIQSDSKKRELDALRRHHTQENGFKVLEMWQFEWWRLYKKPILIINIFENTFFTGVHLQLSNF